MHSFSHNSPITQTTTCNNFSLSSFSLHSISFNRSLELSRMKLAPLAPDLLDWTEMKLTLRQCHESH